MAQFLDFQRCQQQEGMCLRKVATLQMTFLGGCNSYVTAAGEAILIELPQL